MLTAPAAFAQTTTYDCKVASLEGRGFIQDRVIFSVNPNTGQAAVVDGVVMYVYEKPIAADFQLLGNGQYRLKWEVNNLKSGSQSFNVDYTLQYRPNDKGFTMRGWLSGFANRPFGSGTCAVSSGRALF